MVSVPEAYDFMSPGVAPGDLEGGLISLGTAIAKKSFCEIFVCDLSQTLREMNLGFIEECIFCVVDIFYLFFNGLDDLGVLDPKVDIE